MIILLSYVGNPRKLWACRPYFEKIIQSIHKDVYKFFWNFSRGLYFEHFWCMDFTSLCGFCVCVEFKTHNVASNYLQDQQLICFLGIFMSTDGEIMSYYVLRYLWWFPSFWGKNKNSLVYLFISILPAPTTEDSRIRHWHPHIHEGVQMHTLTSHRVHYRHSHPSTHPMPSWDLDQNRPTQKNKTAENLSSQVPNRCHIQREDYLSQDLSPPHPVLLATSPQTTLILFIFCLVIPIIPKWQVVYFNWLLLCPKVTL